MSIPAEPLRLELDPAVVGDATPDVGALWCRPAEARAAYVFAHGAGAGMEHAFMARVARELAARGVATLRYQFPYLEAGKRRPDPPKRLVHTVRRAVALAGELAPELPLFAGGKSMGGRMTSTAAAEAPLPGVHGLVFLGYPLHPPKKPGTARAAHLAGVTVPMLFLSGTRDDLADLELLRPVLAPLPLAALHVVEGGDHSLAVLKRSGRTNDEAMAEVCDTAAAWIHARSDA